MRLAFLVIFALCLVEYGYTYCCFRTQPSTACGCSESPCGACTNCNSCSNVCGCGASTCGCYRDSSNVCSTCCGRSSPVCSCMRECNCDSKCIYFPEVEYPVTVMEVKPNYYGACWSY